MTREATMRRPAGWTETEPDVVRASVSFDSFYMREFPRMVAVVYAMTGSRWSAEELAQEAMLRAYRSWDQISTYDKPGAWLRRVTINLATSHLRRRVTEAKALVLLKAQARSPLPAHGEGEVVVWNAVRRLPRRQREAFALHYVDGLSTAEIGEVLDIAESTVRTHLQRARDAVLAATEGGWPP
jgi:RNA polymerase sigma-70 factor (ECF subfamily)